MYLYFLSAIDVNTLKHNCYFSSPKRLKKLMILSEMRKILSVSDEILSSSFLPGLPFANDLSGQELNQLAD